MRAHRDINRSGRLPLNTRGLSRLTGMVCGVVAVILVSTGRNVTVASSSRRWAGFYRDTSATRWGIQKSLIDGTTMGMS